MYYADYKKYDFLNGTGVRNSLFVSGCSHKCKGCFNAKAWNPCFGKPFSLEMEDQIIVDLDNESVRGLSLLGGEPFENIDGLLPLVRRVKDTYSDKDIWCWSGYTFEQILENDNMVEFVRYIDILVDGKYILELKDLRLKFRGSSNQRVIDVQESLKCGKVVEIT